MCMCMSVCVLLISEPRLQEMVGLIRLVECRLPALEHETWREGVVLWNGDRTDSLFRERNNHNKND